MIYYLTFNDTPSGIFSSQVCDVVNFLGEELGVKIKLVSFISLRNFVVNRKKIKRECPDAVVFPMIPGIKRWRTNVILLKIVCFFGRPKGIIGRSVLATNLAFLSGVKKVVYDGRGAISAEWKEYDVVNSPGLIAQIDELERRAILQSDFRIAVSSKLVDLWRMTYGYTENDQVVIPCTLNKVFIHQEINQDNIQKCRRKMNFYSEDIVFIYSGSLAGWQSFDLLQRFISPLMTMDSRIKMLFLSDLDENILSLKGKFPNQVLCKRVKPEEVPQYLMAGDYGMLIREQSDTNKVASPVKFAEYLACGLNIIISKDLGDYTEFVRVNNCGINNSSEFHPKNISLLIKQRNQGLALDNFTKKKYLFEYRKIIEAVG